MVLDRVQKNKFSQLNDKRYYFQCGIISIPFSHASLNEINQFKWSKKQKIENWFLKKRELLKKLEKEALCKIHRLTTIKVFTINYRSLET